MHTQGPVHSWGTGSCTGSSGAETRTRVHQPEIWSWRSKGQIQHMYMYVCVLDWADQTKSLVSGNPTDSLFLQNFVTKLPKVNGCGRHESVTNRAKTSSLASCTSNSGSCRCDYLSSTNRMTDPSLKFLVGLPETRYFVWSAPPWM